MYLCRLPNGFSPRTDPLTHMSIHPIVLPTSNFAVPLTLKSCALRLLMHYKKALYCITVLTCVCTYKPRALCDIVLWFSSDPLRLRQCLQYTHGSLCGTRSPLCRSLVRMSCLSLLQVVLCCLWWHLPQLQLDALAPQSLASGSKREISWCVCGSWCVWAGLPWRWGLQYHWG